MSGQILVSPDQLRQHVSVVRAAANDARSQFSTLQASLSSLQDLFQGAASQAFEGLYTEWDQNAQGITAALDALGKFLDDAARTVEETDQQLASGLGG